MHQNFKKSKIGRTVLVAAAVAGIGFITIGATASQETSQEHVDKTIYVQTDTPTIGDIVLTSEFVGTVEPDQHVTVYPKVSAEVIGVNYSIGDTVTAGDVLFELDSRALRSTISQSEASIASAQAKAQHNLEMAEKNHETYLYNLENGFDSSLISADSAVNNAESNVLKAENAVQTASANLASARRNLRDHRDKDEWDFGGDEDTYDQVTDQLRDAVVQAELAVESAQISLENAEATLMQAKETQKATQKLVQDQNTNTEDAVMSARLNTNFSDQQVALQKLRDDLSYYTVTAPISGVIEQRAVDPFDMVSPQTPAYTISNKDVMCISFSVPESSLGFLNPGDTIIVERNGTTCTGQITEISTMVVNGLYPVKASVARSDFDLNTGATVKVYADAQKAINSLLIPLDAIQYEDGVPHVYIYENGIARHAQIETDIADSKYMAVISGITSADNIIVTWNSKLSDGATVSLPVERAEETVQQVDDAIQPTDVEAMETAGTTAQASTDSAAQDNDTAQLSEDAATKGNLILIPADTDNEDGEHSSSSINLEEGVNK